MRLDLVGVLADARALWRRERELLVPIAGMFFFVPMLAIVLLLANSGFPGDATPEQLREAIAAFYEANIVAILAANLAIAFGSFTVLNLFFQGGGRTLGEVLGITLRRFLPYLAIYLIASVLFSFGLSLLVLPGLFVFGRTWLAAPSFAAMPEKGPIHAFREGWRRSAGFNWIVLLAAAMVTVIVAMLLIVVSSVLIGGLATLVEARVALVIGHVVTALIGGLAWTGFALLRVAAYRRTEPSIGT
ncbi:hypothetical protein RZN05_00705 [Sphingomonas sp. HF-S4]|uniref:Glycerophosphoryl diester phosphodiesterase membrane domain-containing protein n=1 Tax=Sphingomonas agrestis TaxID=3080540 RepID=A0ABU3Y2I6_9SPHN|nr:hypothetical protein [Sphingomonas sp. HF-S4]MDV3455486.1 hypothetical protein [Sphingomonas sp. HF-S4]